MKQSWATGQKEKGKGSTQNNDYEVQSQHIWVGNYFMVIVYSRYLDAKTHSLSLPPILTSKFFNAMWCSIFMYIKSKYLYIVSSGTSAIS